MWELRGTDVQNRIVAAALDRCDFPWARLLPGLRASTGRATIPVDWADLSRWTTTEQAHLLDVRGRVLGAAWYSGRITLDLSLADDPELAGEVFVAEAAHMVDFFYLTTAMRTAVWNAVHPDSQDVAADTVMVDGTTVGHGHGWFDVDAYSAWVGEAFMSGFILGFSSFPVTIPFDHVVTPEAGRAIRAALLGDTQSGPDTPESPIEPAGGYFGVDRSRVFHDAHRGVDRDVTWLTRDAALAGGRVPCGVCRP